MTYNIDKNDVWWIKRIIALQKEGLNVVALSIYEMFALAATNPELEKKFFDRRVRPCRLSIGPLPSS